MLIVTAPVEMLKDCREPDSYPRQLTEPRQVKARRFSLSSCNLLSISLEGAGSRLIKPQHDPVSKFVPLLFQICEAASPPPLQPCNGWSAWDDPALASKRTKPSSLAFDHRRRFNLR